MGIESVFPQTWLTIGGLEIKDTVIQAWIIIIVLIAFALWASKRLSLWEPRAWQSAVEWLLEYIETLIRDTVGRSVPEIVPYLATMIGFIAIANLLGFLPLMQAPTRDINTTLALSLVSFASCQIMGTRSQGIKGYLKSLATPGIMLPMNLMGFVSRVLSMALRLFGNVISGEIISAVMFMLVPILGPLPLGALSALTGVLQALVFTVLTLVFIVDSMGESEPPSTSPNVTPGV